MAVASAQRSTLKPPRQEKTPTTSWLTKSNQKSAESSGAARNKLIDMKSNRKSEGAEKK